MLKSIRMSSRKLSINPTKSILLPNEVSYVDFQNFKRLTKHYSKSVYGDSECVLIHSTYNTCFGQNTKNIKFILFAVIVISQYALLSDIVNHTNITLVKMTMTNF